jgi:hypothetical protein
LTEVTVLASATAARQQTSPLDRSIMALARVDRSAAVAMASAIHAVCRDPAATTSDLCANGDPVEFAFAWPNGDLRVTCDPAPNAAWEERFDTALALCAASLSAPQRREVNRLRAWLAGQGSWGAWVGLRQRSGQITRKLYVEIAEASPWRDWAPAAVVATPLVPTRTLAPVMAGFDAASGSVEVYFRTPPVHPDVLAALLEVTGLPPRAPALIAEVAFVMQQAVRAAMPGRDQGVSIGFGPGGEARALTWYAHADMLFGPAPRVREAWLEAGARRGWPMAAYAAVSGPGADGRTPWHGLAGFSLGRDGTIAASVTCAMRPGAFE